MGFEQLAALKEQLARKAKAESGNAPAQKAKAGNQTDKPARKQADKPAEKRAGNTSSKPHAETDRPQHAQGRKPAERKAPAQQREPARQVDPVVLSISRLQKHFPKAFPKNPAPKLPLKLGTFEDLAQHVQKLGLTEDELREAIRTWCSGTRYWTSLVEGAPRVDLNGEPAGAVTQADAARARQLKSRRNGKPRPRKPQAAATEQAAATGQAPLAADAAEAAGVADNAVEHAEGQAAASLPSAQMEQTAPQAPSDEGADTSANAASQQEHKPASAPAQQQGE